MNISGRHVLTGLLALLIAAGSTIGAQLGARVSRHLRGEQLLIVLGVLALAVGIKMAVGIIVTPSNLLSGAGGHAALRTGTHVVLAQTWDITRLFVWR